MLGGTMTFPSIGAAMLHLGTWGCDRCDSGHQSKIQIFLCPNLCRGHAEYWPVVVLLHSYKNIQISQQPSV